MDRSPSLWARILEAARNFDARTADWAVWRRLVVFVPVFLVLAMLLVFAILGAVSGLHGLIGH